MHKLLNDIDSYYTNKIKEHGTTPQGVDWNGEESQILRFKQLTQIISEKEYFSLSDIGCGYGKYYEFLQKQFQNFRYTGYDLSNSMILAAKELYGENETKSFKHIQNIDDVEKADYLVASGIFNVKMGYCDDEWKKYIVDTLYSINAKSRLGFAFNILTKYSDKEYMKNNLYYADPCFFFDLCKSHFSKNVSLLHDYGLYEFTILVKKEPSHGL